MISNFIILPLFQGPLTSPQETGTYYFPRDKALDKTHKSCHPFSPSLIHGNGPVSYVIRDHF
jgi:hypothetical protein